MDLSWVVCCSDCGNTNFSWRDSCNRCHSSKPGGDGGSGGGFGGSDDGKEFIVESETDTNTLLVIAQTRALKAKQVHVYKLLIL